jgi:hypothetical protein
MHDQDLIDLINTTSVVNNADKDFLFANFGRITSLEKFKLKNGLDVNNTKDVLVFLQLLKLKFPTPKEEKSNSIFDKINQFINPTPEELPVSLSILTKASEIGSQVPRPQVPTHAISLNDINNFEVLEQLLILNPDHLYVVHEDQKEVVMQRFLQKLDSLFSNLLEINSKRNWLATYLQSPLFLSYMNTGITAMKNPEIEPRRIILDTLHQANNTYLNGNQFEMASIITNHIRHLSGI